MFKRSYRFAFFVSIFILFLTFLIPTCSARVLYVSPGGVPDGTGDSWVTAFNTITAGLTASASGDEIWVKSATYSEAITLKEGVAIYGGFVGAEIERDSRDWVANQTVIDATGLERSVVYCAGRAMIDGFTLTGGNASMGGGVYAHLCSPILVNCTITGNSAKDGGGVYCEYSPARMTNCSISDNSATNSGGGISCRYSTITFTSSTITGNNSVNGGGGIYCYCSSPVLTGCTITGNTSSLSGGGLYCIRYSPTILDCTLANNQAESAGGGVCSDDSSLAMENCTIENNSTHTNGGGIFWSGSYPSLTHCTVKNNSANKKGGGIYSGNTTSILTNCTITENTAVDNGGGIYCGSTTSTLTNCTITENTAEKNGGGISISNSNPILAGCMIASNYAEGRGGGILSDAKSTPTLTNCTISENASFHYGGGIHCSDSSPVEMTNCTISGNSAWSGGCGICCNSASPTLTNCVVTGNSSINIYCNYASPTLTNCTIADSTTGLHCIYESFPTLTNCILWNAGPEIIIEMSGTPTVQYSCIQNGWSGEGNIDGRPLFVDAAGGDYHLCEGSSCIDRGLVSAAPDEDRDGNARPGDDGLVDIGAFETEPDWEPGAANHTPTRWYVRADAPASGDGTSWESAWSTLSSALDIAGTSDEIWVQAGHYAESIQIESPVTILGGFIGTETSSDQRNYETNLTIIDATGLESSVVRSFADAITLDGFTLTGGSAENGGGVYSNYASLTLNNCIITNNEASLGGGVYCTNSSPQLINCTISNNTASSGGGFYSIESPATMIDCQVTGNEASSPYSKYGNGGGLYCYSRITMTNCIINGNTASNTGGGGYLRDSSRSITNCLIVDNSSEESGGGIYCQYSSPNFVNCTLVNNHSNNNGGGIYCYYSSPTFTNCILRNNGSEIVVDYTSTPSLQYSCIQSGWPGEGNINSNPTFVDAENGDYHLCEGSIGIDQGLVSAAPEDDLEGNARPGSDGLVDMGAYETPADWEPGSLAPQPQRWYVRADATAGGDGTSWESALPTISSALHVAGTSDEIWVQEGIYYESVGLISGVYLFGGFTGSETAREERDWTAHETIIDASGLKQSVIISADSATLDGFTLTGGNAENGGGVYCVQSSPILKNCTLTVNTAKSSGGGLYCDQSSPTLENCVLSSNSAQDGAGLLCQNESYLTLTDCTIEANAATENGGGVSCSSDSSLKMSNCTIQNNSSEADGGGFFITSNDVCSITSCRISGNSTLNTGGGLYFSSYSAPTLTNCTITGNYARDSGSGLLCGQSSDPILTNCTLADNFAQNDNGSLYCKNDSRPQLINCILWNRGKEVVTYDNRYIPTIQYSCIQGGWPGEGNIDGEPLFVDREEGDFHLSEGSACIDRGLVSAAPDEDQEGNLRPGSDGLVDMGAYESNPDWVSGPENHIPTRWYVRTDAPAEGDGTSWETAWPSITTALHIAGSSDEVWVQKGLYHEAIVMESSVALYGGFLGDETARESRDWKTHRTIIDATGLNRSVVTGANNATLDGFIITGGLSNRGGGVYCYGSSFSLKNCILTGNSADKGGGAYWNYCTPEIANCTFTNNTATALGGGIYFYYSSPIITNSTITQNSTEEDGGGVYFEYNSSLTMKDCTIAGNSATSRGGSVYCHYGCSLTLTGCTIMGNSAMFGGGFYCSTHSKPTFVKCTITGNTSLNYGGGLSLSSHSDTLLINCLITGNLSNHQGGALFSWYASPTLMNCTLADNSAADDGSGMYCAGSSIPTLINCILWNFGKEILSENDAPDIQYSCIQGGWPGEGNIDGEPLFVDATIGDYRLQEGSSCIDRGLVSSAPTDDLEGNSRPGSDGLVDMGVYESTDNWQPGPANHIPKRWYVRADATADGDGTSWATALPLLSSALDVAGSSDEVWVQEGTYREAIKLAENVTLYGGFAGHETTLDERNWLTHETIIDASGLARSVVIGENNAILDGFTLTGGIAENGGGVYCNQSSPTLRNCTLTGNSATSDGGGLYCYEASPLLINCTLTSNSSNQSGGGLCIESSTPTLMNCTISNNEVFSTSSSSCYGGGLCFLDSSPSLTNCTITGNSAVYGGGLSCSLASPTIINCTIAENSVRHYGGGLYCFNNSTPRLKDCILSNNSALGFGGGVYSTDISNPTLTNCAITNNTSELHGGGVYCDDESGPILLNCLITGNTTSFYGGGVYCNDSSPILTNCTVADNEANGDGNGLFISRYSSPILTNCIIWNKGQEIEVDYYSAVTVQYSCIQNGWPGEGNIAGDPLFVDQAAGDYHLSEGSACIDRGLISAATDEDLAGNPRPGIDGLVDMGAFETSDDWLPGPANNIPTHWYVRADASAGGDGTSWESAWSTLTAALQVSGTSDEIWVQAGWYPEAILIESNVTLLGGFAGTETSADQRNPETGQTIIDATGFDQSAIMIVSECVTLDGFTLTGGWAPDTGGGGVYCYRTSLEMKNCIISNNVAYHGGGLYCYDSSLSLTNCTLSENLSKGLGGGMRGYYDSLITLNHCIVQNNSASTKGGGFYISSDSSLTLTNSLVVGNSAGEQGGGLYLDSNTVMTNCTVTGNSAQYGGGWYSDSDIWMTLTNCIIWDNYHDVVIRTLGRTKMEYCCIEGGWKDEGNIDSDPMFVSPWDGISCDLRLRPGSPCIDTGSAVILDTTTDLAGNPRMVDIPGIGTEGTNAYDMGAYESQSFATEDGRGIAFLTYSILWQRSEEALPANINETEYQLYNTWIDEVIDWKDLITSHRLWR